MAEWVIDVIGRLGYAGVALLMLAENLFPPLPSELIMPFAGFLAARGDLHPVGVVAAGALGSLVGALPWYWAGRKVGADRLKDLAERHGRWIALTPAEIERGRVLFEKKGPLVLVFGRLVPALRTVVALPAGLARMGIVPFMLWTVLGSLIWTSLLTLAGYLLESQYERIEKWLNPVSTGIFVLIAIWYVVRVVRHPSGHAERKPAK
ncbi:DedA family protein [Ramlibacter pallidus]|uniref:DedA family protein n=1 Tax=Ramlibacter pallidus TaxID=2780087 RepID=A0ABR9S8W0_9BURK|nr:DedA family protein [Ramlibacter pallidus]MBE7369984.1 DedA family protein [Ramlibacter pallidus]